MRRILLGKDKVFQGDLILVNARYPYHEEYQGKNVDVEGTALAADAANALDLAMGRMDGWKNIVPVSGWRSREEQQEIWDESMRDNGEAFTRTYVAVPGHSEHQTGLAIDLGLRKEEIDFIRPDFPYEGVCQTFREHAAEFGFVERYPSGKEPVTGIGHEPWHFRYVNTVHARFMKEMGMVMEEYIPFLTQFVHGENPYRMEMNGCEVLVSYRRAERAGQTEMEVDERAEVSVSGNNVDGFVITQWMKERH